MSYRHRDLSAIAIGSKLAALTAYPYTNATPRPQVSIVKSVDLTDMRKALDAARSTLHLRALTYTNAATPGTIIRATDIMELPSGVQ